MNTEQAIYTIVIGGGAFISLITPMLKLNTSIVNLTSAIDHMKELDEVRDRRITKHGEEIEHNKDVIFDMKHELSNHETRIKSLENDREKFK